MKYCCPLGGSSRLRGGSALASLPLGRRPPFCLVQRTVCLSCISHPWPPNICRSQDRNQSATKVSQLPRAGNVNRATVCKAYRADPDILQRDADRLRRNVFGFHDWEKHKSSTRYWRHLEGIFRSRIVISLAGPLLAVITVALFISVYETCREAGVEALRGWPSLALEASDALNLTSFALSLLLVFRTNESYSRWLEARKLWSEIVFYSRDLQRMGLAMMEPQDVASRALLTRWTIAFSAAMMVLVRGDISLEDELQGVLEPRELRALLAARHASGFVLRVLTEVVLGAPLERGEALPMLETLQSFERAVASCERILRTPIPLSYTRHTSRFLVIWLAVLPFSLWPVCHLATAPVAALIAFLLLGIEEIGVQIEEPFSYIHLEDICGIIRADLLAAHAADASVQDLVSDMRKAGGNTLLAKDPVPVEALAGAAARGDPCCNGR